MDFGTYKQKSDNARWQIYLGALKQLYYIAGYETYLFSIITAILFQFESRF